MISNGTYVIVACMAMPLSASVTSISCVLRRGSALRFWVTSSTMASLSASVNGSNIASYIIVPNSGFSTLSPLRTLNLLIRSCLATSKSSSGTIIGYSTGPGETAIDGGKGELSFYTASLIQEMSKTGLDIEDVFKYTSRSVAKETYNRQTPWYSSSLLVDFYFTEKK